MLDKYVTDTHGLYWYLTASPKLGVNARAIFERADRGECIIFIPSLVMAELYYLIVKLRGQLDFKSEYQRLTNAEQFRFIDFRADDMLAFPRLLAIPEMHDRIIAGVAYRYGIPILTKDASIIDSGLLQTIW